jgi:hypothetical protein
MYEHTHIRTYAHTHRKVVSDARMIHVQPNTESALASQIQKPNITSIESIFVYAVIAIATHNEL